MQPTEIICEIFQYISAYDQIKILSAVCIEWYQTVKFIQTQTPPLNFEDFILNDHVYYYLSYSDFFNQNIYFMPLLCRSNLQKLIPKFHQTTKIGPDLLLYWLVKNKFLKIIKHVCTNNFINSIQNILPYVLAAINNNDEPMVKYFLLETPLKSDNSKVKACVDFSFACGYLNMVKHFYQYVEKPNKNDLIKIAHTASIYNQLNILEYCLENGTDLRFFYFDFYTNCDSIFYLKVIDMFKKYSPNHHDKYFLDCIQTVIAGDIVKLKIINKYHKISYMVDIILIVSVISNHLNIIKYVCEEIFNITLANQYRDLFENNMSKIFMIALRRGNMQIVRYLYENYKEIVKEDQYGNFIISSISSGNLDLVKFLFELQYTTNDINIVDHSSLFNTGTNIINIIKWIYDNYPGLVVNYNFILEMCLQYGDVYDLMYFKKIKRIDKNIKHYMSSAIQYNNHTMVKYFYDKL